VVVVVQVRDHHLGRGLGHGRDRVRRIGDDRHGRHRHGARAETPVPPIVFDGHLFDGQLNPAAGLVLPVGADTLTLAVADPVAVDCPGAVGSALAVTSA
jgi:hypothetical protein